MMVDATAPASTQSSATARPPRGKGMKIDTPEPTLPSIDKLRKQHQNLDFGSPVNQNGSFEFDRIIKSGTCLKRTRKTKNWKPVYIVLRPNLLSIYKDHQEKKLRHQLDLSELTAIARQRDPKQRALHVFGLFSPSRNYHLDAPSEKEAQEWVELIRREARIDEEEEEMVLLSPTVTRNATPPFPTFARRDIASSSSEADVGAAGVPSATAATTTARPPSASMPRPQRRPSHALTYSGNEQGSYSDFSDTGAVEGTASFHNSSTSLPQSAQDTATVVADSAAAAAVRAAGADAVYGGSAVVGAGGLGGPTGGQDDERVACHGWLYLLKSKGGVRQWKRVWVVLRPKALAIYKNEEEYAAYLVLPFPSILDAVELDPISRSKRFCIQLIAEDRGYRFCAPTEDALARWLGAFKALLQRRREAETQGAGAVAKTASPPVSATPAAGSAPAGLAVAGAPAGSALAARTGGDGGGGAAAAV